MGVNVDDINYMLERVGNVTIKQIEIVRQCKILHKILPTMKRYYHNDLPKKISKVEFDIILGRFKEESLEYRKKVKDRKKQRRLKEWIFQ
jgi:hypothetical protein